MLHLRLKQLSVHTVKQSVDCLFVARHSVSSRNSTMAWFGGFGGGAAKKKGKQMGAVTAIGGTAFIKKTTDRSLNNVDDYIGYLQIKHSGSVEYQKGMASAMALYPEMEGRTDIAMKNAYKKAAKTAKKK